MNISEIKDLLAQFDASTLREFSYKNNGEELNLSKNQTSSVTAAPVVPTVEVVAPAPQAPVAPVAAPAAVETPATPVEEASAQAAEARARGGRNLSSDTPHAVVCQTPQHCRTPPRQP